MKNSTSIILLINFLICFPFGDVSAQSYGIGTPVSITGYGNYHPQIEISNDNAPIILWTDFSTKSVYFAKHNGTDFDTPIQINPSGFDVQAYNWSGADLYTSQDNIYVTFRSNGYETGHIYIVKSEDNGLTFGDTIRVDNLSEGFGQYPDVAVYNDTVFVTFMDHDASGQNPQYVVSRSVDGGLTFEAEVVAGVLVGDEACECCQPEIIVNDKYVVVFFRNNASNIRDIKGVVSYDRGATFTNWISVDDHQWSIMSCPSTGPDARFTNNSTSLTAYKTEENGETKIFLNEYSILSDASLSTTKISSSSIPNVNYPQLASSGNNIGVVWEGFSNSTDVFFNASTSGVSGLDTNNSINITDKLGAQAKPDIIYHNNSYYLIYADMSSLEFVEVSQALSINNVEKDESLQVFPNPVGDVLSLELPTSNSKNIQIIMTDMNGKIVHNKSYTSGTQNQLIQIDVSKIPSGAYLIEARDKSTTTKSVITKY